MKTKKLLLMTSISVLSFALNGCGQAKADVLSDIKNADLILESMESSLADDEIEEPATFDSYEDTSRAMLDSNGSISGRTYTNEYYNIQFDIPENWYDGTLLDGSAPYIEEDFIYPLALVYSENGFDMNAACNSLLFSLDDADPDNSIDEYIDDVFYFQRQVFVDPTDSNVTESVNDYSVGDHFSGKVAMVVSTSGDYPIYLYEYILATDTGDFLTFQGMLKDPDVNNEIQEMLSTLRNIK